MNGLIKYSNVEIFFLYLVHRANGTIAGLTTIPASNL